MGLGTMTEREPNKVHAGEADAQRLRIGRSITATALVLALAHLLVPSISVDAITIALFVIAVVPWLGSVFHAIELPGGLKIQYHELQRAKDEAEQAGLLAQPPPTAVQPAFLAIADQDPNLALAGLRIEIEKRLRVLAVSRGIDTSRQSIGPLLRRLSAEEVLSHRERSVLADMIGLLNGAVHGAALDPRATQWALDIAPQLLAGLDQLAEHPPVARP